MSERDMSDGRVDRPHPDDCDHVFGPYFTRALWRKRYWLKCFRCLARLGPYRSEAAVKEAWEEVR